MTGIELIAEERQRQITEEGWTPENDDQHCNGALARAAAAYALPAWLRSYPLLAKIWPFSAPWWKPTPMDRNRELIKAGALIAAELDRRNRAFAAANCRNCGSSTLKGKVTVTTIPAAKRLSAARLRTVLSGHCEPTIPWPRC